MNLFEIVGKISLDADEYTREIENATDKASRFADKLGNGIANAVKVGVSALGVASAGIGAMTKASLEAYADYEQLVGGVETLFKDSANIVQEYAANAYKTAGVSANQYMETVTSFSASLIASLGGDTQEAAEYANRALVSMSDNANKLGTDMTLIQNAYQGFAKSNYTMLDNLKLGRPWFSANHCRV